MIPLNRSRNRTFPYDTLTGWEYRGLPLASGESIVAYAPIITDNAAGYKQPGWKRLVRTGQQAGTPYSRACNGVSVYERGDFTMTYKYVDTSVIPNRVGTRRDYAEGLSGVSFPPFHMGTTTKADNRALIRIRFAVKAEYERTNALISLAEGRDLISTIRKPFAAVFDEVDQHLARVERKLRGFRTSSTWRNGTRREKARKMTAIISQSWLETSFAIRPTLSDVVATAEALSAWQSKADTRRSAVKGFAMEEFGEPPTVTHNLSFGLPYARHTVVERQFSEHRVIYRAGIRMHMLCSSSFKDLARVAGFVPENFVPTLYEAIPFSWLVDYFTTLGQALNANATVTRDLLWVVKSTSSKTYIQRVSTIDPSRFTPGLEQMTYRGTSLGKWETYLTSCTRELITPNLLPAVPPEFRSLSELNPMQVSNILALITAKLAKVRSLTSLSRI